MIVIDTNVISEPLKPSPDIKVLVWLNRQGTHIALTTVSIAELFYGANRLPDGRRRKTLIDLIGQVILVAGDRRLPFDEESARAYAALRADHEAHGKQISTEDGMIAGICRRHGATLATRNVRDFEGLGLTLINPWED